jgi:hypothetical protein
VATHLAHLVKDADYAPLAEMLADTRQPAPVLEALFTDVLNRPNAIKLPALLEVARQPDHAKATQAREILQLYLDADYEDDWDRWQEKMTQWLKDNPD